MTSEVRVTAPQIFEARTATAECREQPKKSIHTVNRCATGWPLRVHQLQLWTDWVRCDAEACRECVDPRTWQSNAAECFSMYTQHTTSDVTL